MLIVQNILRFHNTYALVPSAILAAKPWCEVAWISCLVTLSLKLRIFGFRTLPIPETDLQLEYFSKISGLVISSVPIMNFIPSSQVSGMITQLPGCVCIPSFAYSAPSLHYITTLDGPFTVFISFVYLLLFTITLLFNSLFTLQSWWRFIRPLCHCFDVPDTPS